MTCPHPSSVHTSDIHSHPQSHCAYVRPFTLTRNHINVTPHRRAVIQRRKSAQRNERKHERQNERKSNKMKREVKGKVSEIAPGSIYRASIRHCLDLVGESLMNYRPNNQGQVAGTVCSGANARIGFQECCCLRLAYGFRQATPATRGGNRGSGCSHKKRCGVSRRARKTNA